MKTMNEDQDSGAAGRLAGQSSIWRLRRIALALLAIPHIGHAQGIVARRAGRRA